METISTSELSKIAGISLPVIFLKSIGLKPAFENKVGTLWNKDEVDSILMQVGLYFITKSDKSVKKRGRPLGSKNKGKSNDNNNRTSQ